MNNPPKSSQATVTSLKKQIEKLESDLREEKIRTGTQSQRATVAETRCHEKDTELRNRIKAHEDQLASERRARENAETSYDQHRSAVLHYFMAASNPDTAKDSKRLVELQGMIVGIIPPRAVEYRQKAAWEA